MGKQSEPIEKGLGEDPEKRELTEIDKKWLETAERIKADGPPKRPDAVSSEDAIARGYEAEGGRSVREPEREASPIEHIRLNSLTKAFRILHGPQEFEREDGKTEKVSWRDLYKEIGDFDSSIDLSDQIRAVTLKWVENTTPALKDSIAVLRDLPDDKIVSAIGKNLFSEVPEVEGQRREVLLATMASTVKRIESRMWQKKLEGMDDKDLAKMGIDASERDLATGLLKISAKANPLFVRFLAYSRLSPEASEKADLQKFEVPGHDEKLFSLSQMFPKETGFLSGGFAKLIKGSEKQEWATKPGAGEMVKFLQLMSEIYAKGITPEKAQELQGQVEEASDELIKSGFPIVIIPSVEGMFKDRHVDPEVKICLESKDCIEQDKKFERAKTAVANCLEQDGLGEFADILREKLVKSLIELGENGVNLAFKAVAQESKGTNVMFVNEQRRSYDEKFPHYLSLIKNSEGVFSGVGDGPKQEMSRMLSMLHEFSHLHVGETGAADRMGEGAEEVISEVEAESVYRSFLPEIVRQQGVEGNKEQWACAMLTASLLMLKDPDSYEKSAGFTLKSAIDKGALSWDGKQLTINDFDALFEIQQQSAKEVIGLFEDKDMTEKKADAWVDKNCSDKTIDEITKFVREQP